MDFTESEEKLFHERFESGYDLTSDSRYNAWLELNHLHAAVLSRRQMNRHEPAPPLKQRMISRVPLTKAVSSAHAIIPSAPCTTATAQLNQHKKMSRILTSEDCLRQLEEKEKKKGS